MSERSPNESAEKVATTIDGLQARRLFAIPILPSLQRQTQNQGDIDQQAAKRPPKLDNAPVALMLSA